MLAHKDASKGSVPQRVPGQTDFEQDTASQRYVIIQSLSNDLASTKYKHYTNNIANFNYTDTIILYWQKVFNPTEWIATVKNISYTYCVFSRLKLKHWPLMIHML